MSGDTRNELGDTFILSPILFGLMTPLFTDRCDTDKMGDASGLSPFLFDLIFIERGDINELGDASGFSPFLFDLILIER